MINSILKRHIWVLNLFLIAVLAYVLAQTIIDRLRVKIAALPREAIASLKSTDMEANEIGETPEATSRRSYDVILKGVYPGSTGNKTIDSVPQTTLNLELLATNINYENKSVAVIKNVDTGMIDGYAEDDMIDIIKSERVKIVKIDKCVVVLERRNEGPETIKCNKEINNSSTENQETVAKIDRSYRNTSNVKQSDGQSSDDEAEGIKQIEDGVYEVDQKMLDELLSNPNEIITKARVIPQNDGLRFFAIRPNSVFNNIGIKNGDTIHRINDVELNNVQNALSLFEQLRGQRRFTIDLTRRGQKLTFEYNAK